MPRYAIDATTLLLLVDEGHRPPTDVQLVAPKSVLVDGLELLLAAVRAGQRDADDALRAHTRMTETRIRLLGDRVSRRRAWELALAHGWDGVHVAEYVAVAQLQADALVAGDPALRAAAAGVVALAEPAVLVG
ncbi:hypothetical protein [Cellulomonas fimi]|uniref:PIN domain-containing protein n=1 Tax=Cellulomonas fimi (strain ATCC 484 / DSM 20113 / JCM 1341 / CCUG 24087 / LMG 16345 / NBRC 15513 / NCIMB 8980 / NCTC 7547 / NRS-133) TaxID=590998 RepID=F4H8M3_CELFA|nr:hypothetical protein [Cellulomonas fimi]AEE47031.1 hypothetical protein Celf_2909 [Cellulomonas fimi ATCC 484]NNH07774.1 hypothetical protein [Cellulomonas fimi]VEH34907.1 Uncharacterised protein [Cellulomonas fimi]